MQPHPAVQGTRPYGSGLANTLCPQPLPGTTRLTFRFTLFFYYNRIEWDCFAKRISHFLNQYEL